ncbi:MAG TPA: TIR domain-containing protein [Thermoanaerobaculia bacterium]|nr:TIR domain-containing protein [Thermoanaerobaculia bacterium]
MARFKVLLVENNETSREIWRLNLVGKGYDVVECASVGAAQDVIRTRLNEFDVAVIDLRLKDDYRAGDDSGYRLARGDIHGRIPVVLMTASDDTETLIAATQPGSGKPIVSMLKSEEIDGLHRRIQSLVTHRVFVAYGHDPIAKNAVMDCLKILGVRPVTLSSEPRKHKAITELLDEVSNVSFAVIVLTPDDLGRRREEVHAAYQPRARQNVILEWGYFVGKLGGDHVTVLCRNDGEQIEMPSNSGGVLWTEMDSADAWRIHLAKALNAAGIPVDTERAAYS